MMIKRIVEKQKLYLFTCRFAKKKNGLIDKCLLPYLCQLSSRCGPFEAEHAKRYQNRVFNP